MNASDEYSQRAKSASPTRSVASSSTNTVRRLANEDVRDIFECLHNKRPIPAHLPFKIFPVGISGQKLSPPSYEFDDGLYVLLKPQKKSKGGTVDIPEPPAHLKHLVIEDTGPENCIWSLSGPQFPKPTAIQQRYCYPKGDPAYSSRKGGALWTFYNDEGKEDLKFRLLHVYYSHKRAANRGAPKANSPKKTKRVAARRAPDGHAGHPKGIVVHEKHLNSPAVTTSSISQSSLCGSPMIGYNHFPTNQAFGMHHPYEQPSMPPLGQSSYVNPHNSFSPMKWGMGPQQPFRPPPPPETWRQQVILSPPSLSQQRGRAHLPPPANHASIGASEAPDLFRAGMLPQIPRSPVRRSSARNELTDAQSLDSFRLADNLEGVETLVQGDPTISSLTSKDSYDEAHDNTYDVMAGMNFQAHLEKVGASLRYIIDKAPFDEKPKMESMLKSWAHGIAAQPMGETTMLLTHPGMDDEEYFAPQDDDNDEGLRIGAQKDPPKQENKGFKKETADASSSADESSATTAPLSNTFSSKSMDSQESSPTGSDGEWFNTDPDI